MNTIAVYNAVSALTPSMTGMLFELRSAFFMSFI
jgi:hypothetical protein